MKYRVIQRKNPQDPQAPGLYYANAVNEGKISLREFAKEIEGRSSLTRGDIENVLENFLDELPRYLSHGFSVQLGDLATLRLSLQSEGSTTAEKFHTNLIKGVRVIFTPGMELKAALRDVHFDRQHLPDGSSDFDPGDEDGGDDGEDENNPPAAGE